MSVEVFKQGLELFADQWQAPGSIDFYASGDLDDYISFSVTSDRPLITGVGNYLVLGKDASTGHSLDADDVLFGEDVEIDGILYADGGIVGGTSFNILDNILFTHGTDGDIASLLRSATLTANTALTNVLIGTPVTPALAANSLIVSNVTADGDILFAVNDGGNSKGLFWLDGSAGTVNFLTSSFVVNPDSTGYGIKIEDNAIVVGDSTDSWDLSISWRDASGLRLMDAALNVYKSLTVDDLLCGGSMLFSTDAESISAPGVNGRYTMVWIRSGWCWAKSY